MYHHFWNKIALLEICPAGFQVLHQPRLQGRGGIVAVAIQESLTAFWNAVPQVPRCEILFIKLVSKDQLEFLLLYNPLCCITASLSEPHFSVGSEVPQTWFWEILIFLLWKWGLKCLESSWPPWSPWAYPRPSRAQHGTGRSQQISCSF